MFNSSGFIDKYSWRCLLGKMSKNIEETEDFGKWEVYGKKHLVLFKPLESLNWIEKYVPFGFHYFSDEDLKLLKTKFKVKRNKCVSICLNVEETLNISGKKHRGIRNRINRCEKENFEILNNYKSIEDVKIFVNEWRDKYSLKYFRNYSGKNTYFYSNNFHKDCINVFIYKEKLLAYGTLSPPNNGYSTYIIGKGLYMDYPGMSEFLDFSLYKKAKLLGTQYVNLGGSFKNTLVDYKKKFPGSIEFLEYEGKVE